MSPKKAKRRGSSSDPISLAQAQTLGTFEKVLRKDLKPVLGDAGLKRVRTEQAIVTSVSGGVIVQAPLELPARFTPARLERRSEIVAVIANTVPLVDPVTLRALEPGAYAWAVRKVSKDVFAFDFFNERGAPALSTIARQKDDTGPGGDDGVLDIDIVRGGKDSLVPPGSLYICVSLLDWMYCFFIGWPPRLPWPF